MKLSEHQHPQQSAGYALISEDALKGEVSLSDPPPYLSICPSGAAGSRRLETSSYRYPALMPVKEQDPVSGVKQLRRKSFPASLDSNEDLTVASSVVFQHLAVKRS